MNAKEPEFSNKSLTLNKLREKYRVEIKKQNNTEVFNSKRLKFTENTANLQLNETIFPNNVIFSSFFRKNTKKTRF